MLKSNHPSRNYSEKSKDKHKNLSYIYNAYSLLKGSTSFAEMNAGNGGITESGIDSSSRIALQSLLTNYNNSKLKFTAFEYEAENYFSLVYKIVNDIESNFNKHFKYSINDGKTSIRAGNFKADLYLGSNTRSLEIPSIHEGYKNAVTFWDIKTLIFGMKDHRDNFDIINEFLDKNENSDIIINMAMLAENRRRYFDNKLFNDKLLKLIKRKKYCFIDNIEKRDNQGWLLLLCTNSLEVYNEFKKHNRMISIASNQGIPRFNLLPKGIAKLERIDDTKVFWKPGESNVSKTTTLPCR